MSSVAVVCGGLAVLLLIGFCAAAGGGPSLLYTPSDHLVQLDNATFSSTILGTPNAWLVEFYATWCGHCQRFAPVFKGFASDVIAWQPVFKVAVVACSDPTNRQLCSKYNVRGYPSLKFFPPFAREGFEGYAFQGTISSTGLRAATLQYLKDLVSQGLQPASWPHLTPYTSLEDIRTAYAHAMMSNTGSPGRTRRLYVIVETNQYSHIGTSVILDLLEHYPQVMVATISAADSGLRDLRFPALYRQDINSEARTLLLDNGTRRRLRAAILQDMSGRTAVTTTPTTTAPSTTVTQDDQSDYTPSDGLHMRDLESNLYYSLWVEIGSKQNISGAALRALKSYMDILHRYHPGDAHVKRLIYRINDWLRSNADDVILGNTWTNEITRFQNEDTYIPNELVWTGCIGTEPRYRGYPCSLWMTFHALTVSALYWERNKPHFEPMHVLQPIADYVEHFFSCRYCAAHFKEMAHNMSRDINKRLDVALWLWKAHNKVNSRLHGDPTEDPGYPKVQFPSNQACPTCRAPGAPRDIFNNDTAWNENEVVRYLSQFYGRSFIIDDDSEQGYVAATPKAAENVNSDDEPQCPPDTTPWSACSKTCGIGLATRLTNNNTRCRMEAEVRLCQLRPCDANFNVWLDPQRTSLCPAYGSTYRDAQERALWFGSRCQTTRLRRWRYCGLCPGKCCYPKEQQTITVQVGCGNVIGYVQAMWIERCSCEDECPVGYNV